MKGGLLALGAGVFVLALGVRAWTNTWLTDFWGDSYHHWMITRLTLQNGGVYTDYKGLEVVWTPLYHYLAMVPLLLSGRGDLVPLHWMNTILGALTCALVTWLAWLLYQDLIAAFTAGAALALMSWHIAFSGMNVTEIFSGLLVIGVTLAACSIGQASRSPEGAGRTNLRPFQGRRVLLFLLALAMPLTRTELSIYLGVIVLWAWIQRRYGDALAIVVGAGLGLGGWSLWSYVKTGDALYWYKQYAQNNLHDWLQLNGTQTTGFAFALYLQRLSPFVVPALLAGVLSALQPFRPANFTGRSFTRELWLCTALLGAHTLFLIVGYTRGIVPLLTERYLVIDLPLVAALLGGWVYVIGRALARGSSKPGSTQQRANYMGALVAAVLLWTIAARFRNDLPELQIRRWGIDREWQIGNFLYGQVKPGDVVLTDAPVAIYRSGKPLDQFISSVELAKTGRGAEALQARHVDWIVTQTVVYDAASVYIPRALMQAQTSGTVDGLHFELIWRYDPTSRDIQSEVWHVIHIANQEP